MFHNTVVALSPLGTIILYHIKRRMSRGFSNFFENLFRYRVSTKERTSWEGLFISLPLTVILRVPFLSALCAPCLRGRFTRLLRLRPASLSQPYNVIIADSFEFVYWQNAQRSFNILFYFVQIAKHPGAERHHEIKAIAQQSGVHSKNSSK